MKTFTPPQTSQRLSIAQEIYNLPEPEFKKLYKQSNYLDGWGKFCFFGTFIITIGYALCTILAFSFGGVLPALGVILAGALQALYIYALSHLFRYQRNSSARSIISFYSIFHMVISGLVAICSLFAAFGDIKLLLTAVVPVILFIIFCIIFAASRNPLLFGESALSHAQIECIKYWREKRFFDAECLPKTREPKGSDAFFRIYSIIGIILLFLAIPVGFVKGVREFSTSESAMRKQSDAMKISRKHTNASLIRKSKMPRLPNSTWVSCTTPVKELPRISRKPQSSSRARRTAELKPRRNSSAIRTEKCPITTFRWQNSWKKISDKTKRTKDNT